MMISIFKFNKKSLSFLMASIFVSVFCYGLVGGGTCRSAYADDRSAEKVTFVDLVQDKFDKEGAKALVNLQFSNKNISEWGDFSKLSEECQKALKENCTVLALSGNQLTALPDSIGELANLRALLLANNKLTSLPDSIGGLENLKFLYIKGNPLKIETKGTNLGSLALKKIFGDRIDLR